MATITEQTAYAYMAEIFEEAMRTGDGEGVYALHRDTVNHIADGAETFKDAFFAHTTMFAKMVIVAAVESGNQEELDKGLDFIRKIEKIKLEWPTDDE